MPHHAFLPDRLFRAVMVLPCLLVPGWGVPQERVETDGSAEAVVRELYDLVTFPAGTTPDWNRARALFLPEAVVVLRSSRTETTVFSVEGWMQDFVSFIEGRNVMSTGFEERIVRTHAIEFGDIAHVWVLYEAQIPGSGRPPQPGVDAMHLVRREGRWLIASIVNEIPTPERPVPEVLRGSG